MKRVISVLLLAIICIDASAATLEGKATLSLHKCRLAEVLRIPGGLQGFKSGARL